MVTVRHTGELGELRFCCRSGNTRTSLSAVRISSELARRYWYIDLSRAIEEG